ncbi:MAG: hypothetical protein ACRD0Y_14555 [Terriglobales bacterium]
MEAAAGLVIVNELQAALVKNVKEIVPANLGEFMRFGGGELEAEHAAGTADEGRGGMVGLRPLPNFVVIASCLRGHPRFGCA